MCVWLGCLLLAHCLWVGAGQVVDMSGQECVNGELVSVVSENMSMSMSCQCYPGWSGPQCSLCSGRVRLRNSSGIISEDLKNMNYSQNMSCLFHIEANQSAKAIHIRLHLLHLECQWDYLTIFDGDSLSAPKIAAYTGNLIEQLPAVNITSNDNDTTLGAFPFPQHAISSSGPNLLLYFYSDLGVHGPGFELAYWVDYDCPNFCSERGTCDVNMGRCLCELGWGGEACDVPVCPNNCTQNGVCNEALARCDCFQGFQGDDCGVEEMTAHWSTIPHVSDDVSPSLLARASHSAVLWQGGVLVYGGYQFPEEGYAYFDIGAADGSNSGSSDGGNISDNVGEIYGDLLRYSPQENLWEVLNSSAATYSLVEVMGEGSGSGSGGNEVIRIPQLPAPRYAHSAVIYEDCMYVFGGVVFPSERVVAELWRLNLTTMQWTPLFNTSNSFSSSSPSLPIPVRGHTAHVVGSKMVVLFGISPGEEIFPVYVQEYDFVSGSWSLIRQRGNVTVVGRVGHSSVYSEDTGLIYVHDGRGLGFRAELLSFDPICHKWNVLSHSGSWRYLHSSFLLGPFLVSFGGCQGSRANCFSSDLLLYNTLCNTWDTVQLPGLPPNASRYGHTFLVPPHGGGSGSALVFGGFVGTLRSDMLRLEFGNCSQWVEEEGCLNSSSRLCAWRREAGLCVPAWALAQGDRNINFSSCSVEMLPNPPSSSSSCPPPTKHCANFTSCQGCLLNNCHWGISSNKTTPQCFSDTALEDPVLNVTEVDTCSHQSCFSHDSCGSCLEGLEGACLWCASLDHCLPSSLYSVAFNFGQCLGWSQTCDAIECQQRTNCSSCQQLPQCGWCNDLSDTGLGRCSLGGVSSPRNATTCVQQQQQLGDSVAQDMVGEEGEWQFYQCSACQCNGHSQCLNDSSVCNQCKDNTAGKNCQSCTLGYYGLAENGGSCAECDCNGYDSECDVLTGACQCQALGVAGERCTNCSGDYASGFADNFCFARLEVGFIYTFSVDASNQVQGFYAVTPPHDESLHFKFEMAANPNGLPVVLQLFVGRRTENLFVLANLTDVMVLSPLGSYEKRFDSFSSNQNLSQAQLTSFAHPSFRNSTNFTALFEEATEDDYTSHMWDNDVTLVLHLSNLKSPSTFRITVDQADYIYLLYFFATFITCFTVLLTSFLIVWYVKKKLMLRAYMRQQYVELQRRVARPFTKIMLAVENDPVSTKPLPTEQKPSYLAVEACKDDKAAVLSLFVKLPGDHQTGRPSVGRTALCIGSTLVYINSSKKPKQKKGQRAASTDAAAGGVREQNGRQVPPPQGGGRRAGLVEDSSFVVHTNRHHLRHRSDSQAAPVESV